MAFEQKASNPRRVLVGLGSFHQDPADMAVAGLGDAASFRPLATGVFRGDEPEKRHELLGILKSPEITEFRYRRGGND